MIPEHVIENKFPRNPDIEVQKFFTGFANALSAGDNEYIKKCWGLPSFVLGNSTQMALRNENDIERLFAGTREQYNRRGIANAIPDIESIQWLTPKIALVGVRWPYTAQDGSPLGEESSCYTLKKDESGKLSLAVVVLQGEKKETKSFH